MLTLPLTSWGPSGELLRLSELRFPQLHNEERGLTRLGLTEWEGDCARPADTGRGQVALP